MIMMTYISPSMILSLDDDIYGVIKECIVFSDFMYSPDSFILKILKH